MRIIEIQKCPKCKQLNPWKVMRTINRGTWSEFRKDGSSYLAPNEVVRRYLRCRTCGYTTVHSERDS